MNILIIPLQKVLFNAFATLLSLFALIKSTTCQMPDRYSLPKENYQEQVDSKKSKCEKQTRDICNNLQQKCMMNEVTKQKTQEGGKELKIKLEREKELKRKIRHKANMLGLTEDAAYEGLTEEAVYEGM